MPFGSSFLHSRAAKRRFRRLILHIGTHKTGTSAIQYHLHHERRALARRGVLYPLTGQWGDHSHHRWANAIWHAATEPDALPNLLEDLKQERKASPADTLLLSTELIEKVPLNPVLEPVLVDLLGRLADEVVILTLFRRQDELVESVFKQWVKDQSVRLATPPRQFIDGHGDEIDYMHVIDHWRRLDPVAEIRIQTNALANDPVATVARMAELPGRLTRRARSRQVNPTFDGRPLELKWALNSLELTTDEDRSLRNAISQANFPTETLALFEPSHRQEFLARYEASNKALSRTFDVEPFAPDTPDRTRRFQQLDEAELAVTIAQVRSTNAGAVAPVDRALAAAGILR